MRRRLTWLAMCSAIISITALRQPGRASATTPERCKSTLVAVGRFSEIDVLSHSIPSKLENARQRANVWLSLQKTEGSSDLYVEQNALQPRGSTGWHTHPGHSMVIVTMGTVTAYEGDDPGCTPHVYKQGMTFVDPGGEHVHIIRNESDSAAQTIAVQLIPAGSTRRIDAASPGNCPF
ncbi:MAG: cupin domain-containing protein [Terracidiphilus sp.]